MLISTKAQKRYLGAAVGAAALVFSWSGAANAVPSYGYAFIGFTGFTLTGIVDAAGVPLAGVSGFSSSVLMTADANYPGSLPASNAASGNLASGVDVTQAQSGPAVTGQNIFTQQLTGSSGTRGDGRITGAIASGATSNLVAEGRLTVPPTAGSSAGSGTTITASFAIASARVVNLSFSAIAQLLTSVGLPGDAATAQISASYTIIDSAGATIFSVAPNALNQTRSSQTPGVDGVYNLASTAFSFSNTLAAGTYTLTLSDNAREILQAVAAPEPATLGILGSGLLALGMVVRRRRDV